MAGRKMALRDWERQYLMEQLAAVDPVFSANYRALLRNRALAGQWIWTGQRWMPAILVHTNWLVSAALARRRRMASVEQGRRVTQARIEKQLFV